MALRVHYRPNGYRPRSTFALERWGTFADRCLVAVLCLNAEAALLYSTLELVPHLSLRRARRETSLFPHERYKKEYDKISI